MNFSNIKISVKLSFAFLLMVLLTGVIGLFALTQLARINASTEEIASNWLPSIRHAGEIEGLLNDLRQAETQHAMAVTAEEKGLLGSKFFANRIPMSGGKVVYRKDGPMEPLELRRAIIDVLGRTYASRTKP